MSLEKSNFEKYSYVTLRSHGKERELFFHHTLEDLIADCALGSAGKRNVMTTMCEQVIYNEEQLLKISKEAGKRSTHVKGFAYTPARDKYNALVLDFKFRIRGGIDAAKEALSKGRILIPVIKGEGVSPIYMALLNDLKFLFRMRDKLPEKMQDEFYQVNKDFIKARIENTEGLRIDYNLITHLIAKGYDTEAWMDEMGFEGWLLYGSKMLSMGSVPTWLAPELEVVETFTFEGDQVCKVSQVGDKWVVRSGSEEVGIFDDAVFSHKPSKEDYQLISSKKWLRVKYEADIENMFT